MAKPKPGQKKQQEPLEPAARASAAKLPDGFKVTRTITLPVIVIKKPGESRVLRLDDEMRVSKVEGKKGADGKPQKPATICTATDMVTGEQGIFLVGAVVQSNLERDYPKAGYVKKAFHIANLGKRSEGQRYNDFAIAEVSAK